MNRAQNQVISAAVYRNVELEALVVVGGRSNIEATDCMWCPGSLGSWIIAYQGFGS
jgi:hypothetical protein